CGCPPCATRAWTPGRSAWLCLTTTTAPSGSGPTRFSRRRRHASDCGVPVCRRTGGRRPERRSLRCARLWPMIWTARRRCAPSTSGARGLSPLRVTSSAHPVTSLALWTRCWGSGSDRSSSAGPVGVLAPSTQVAFELLGDRVPARLRQFRGVLGALQCRDVLGDVLVRAGQLVHATFPRPCLLLELT